MVIHDYLTTISCDMCSHELAIECNVGEKRMKQLAGKHGWREVNGNDICPSCAERVAKQGKE